jgi:hypothetical protein
LAASRAEKALDLDPAYVKNENDKPVPALRNRLYGWHEKSIRVIIEGDISFIRSMVRPMDIMEGENV